MAAEHASDRCLSAVVCNRGPLDLAGREKSEMEGLAPSLKCLIEVQSALQNAETARIGLNRYLRGVSPSEPFGSEIRQFLFAWDQAQDWKAVVSRIRSAHRRALLELIASALSGQPVLAHLEELRSEIMTACDLEIRHHLEVLPIKMLMPLLLMQFPAFLLLLFGPLLARLIEELNR